VAAWVWPLGALGGGLFAAVAWLVLTRREPLAAAIEIDRRFALKERVSSTLAMSAEDQQTGAGRALVEDAVHRVERINVASKFSVVPGRQVLLPLLPGLLALVVALMPATIDNTATAKPEDPKAKEQVKMASKALHRKLAERRKQAAEEDLKEAERLFKKLEEGTKQLASRDTQRKKALVKLNDLSRQLQQRRKKLGGADQVRDQLDQLKNINRGPADKFAKAISRGDFKQALEELQKIKNQLANSKLSDEQKEQLAQQLEQMQEKLGRLADAHRAAQEDLQRRIDQLREAGQHAEANKLEEQLDKLMQQAPQMQQLENLADKLNQCARCLRDGQLENAADQLGDFQAGLEDLQKQLDELEMLDEALGQLGQARDQMNCPMCGGGGCEACQGPPRVGMGAGRGKGPRPEAPDDTATYDSQVRQKVGKGSAVVTDLVPGPNVKGTVRQEIHQEVDAARRGNTDPLTGRRIPRQYREHVIEYSNRFREGD
jgi:rubrerythrin